MSTEKKSFNSLPIKPLKEVTEEAKLFISNRKEGIEKSLRLKSHKINSSFMGGLDWNRIITIGGASGAGKSTIARQ